jgi:hypothetical protein
MRSLDRQKSACSPRLPSITSLGFDFFSMFSMTSVIQHPCLVPDPCYPVIEIKMMVQFSPDSEPSSFRSHKLASEFHFLAISPNAKPDRRRHFAEIAKRPYGTAKNHPEQGKSALERGAQGTLMSPEIRNPKSEIPNASCFLPSFLSPSLRNFQLGKHP